MKRIVYYVVIFILVLLVWEIYDSFAPKRDNKEDGENETYGSENAIKANALVFNDFFSKLDIEESQCIIDGYYEYGDQYVSEDSAHEILEGFARDLGITSGYIFLKSEENDTCNYTLQTKGEKFNLILGMSSLCVNGEDGIKYKEYISVDLRLEKEMESGFYYRDKISDCLNKMLGRKEDVPLVIKGEIKGEIDTDKQREISKEIIKELDGKIVYENTGNLGATTYNVYGYCKRFKEKINLAGQKTNLNIAFNYDEKINATYIHIGMPLVNYEY